MMGNGMNMWECAKMLTEMQSRFQKLVGPMMVYNNCFYDVLNQSDKQFTRKYQGIDPLIINLT